MKHIVYSRVDDRLVHGQVMTAWVLHTKANKVIIVDDKSAKDSFMKMIMKSAMPSSIELEVLSVSNAISYLKEEPLEEERIFLLAKTPMVFSDLHDAGVAIQEVGIGGIGARADRRKLYRNIAVNEEELNSIYAMQKKGMDVYIRVVPDDKRIEIKDTAM